MLIFVTLLSRYRYFINKLLNLANFNIVCRKLLFINFVNVFRTLNLFFLFFKTFSIIEIQINQFYRIDRALSFNC